MTRRNAHKEHETRESVSDTSVTFECLDCGIGFSRTRCTGTWKNGLRCDRGAWPKSDRCGAHRPVEGEAVAAEVEA